ncbi:hypothetical protein PG994_013379 [Apiospora phragmitis]|uniref:Uncharacterized protein n=1 Tax=Apiospora phragmitis TaxID=2905665 RepID=A0ABR1T8G9_9PEZI
MEYPQYPYQLKPYTYRQVPYPVTYYGGGWGNGATASGFIPYPGYYEGPIVGPARSPRPRRRPALSPEQELRYLKQRLIKNEPADPNIGPGRPETTPGAEKTPKPGVAPEVTPAAESPPLPPPAIAIPNIEPKAAPLLQEEVATEITPIRDLHYPAKLYRKHVQKLHARNDKPNRSPGTVFVIVHEVDGCNIDIQVSRSLRDAIDEVLRIMARYHPRAFKSTPLRRVGGAAAAAGSEENAAEKGVGLKDEDEVSIDSSPTVKLDARGDDANNKGEAAEETEAERERRFVYKGDWKFTHASTLKLEAKYGSTSIRVSCALKNVRQEKKDPKQGNKEKKRREAVPAGELTKA